MAEHFRYEVVKAGKWRRNCEPVGEHEEVTEDRPHFISQTMLADQFIDIDAVRGYTGLCPGWVRGNGEWTRAYRFRRVDEASVPSMLADLDEAVTKLMCASS
jgi:hypothetical protein